MKQQNVNTAAHESNKRGFKNRLDIIGCFGGDL